MKELGRMLAAYRKSRGLSIRRMAREVGIDHNSLFRLEQGDSDSLSSRNLARIVVLLFKDNNHENHTTPR